MAKSGTRYSIPGPGNPKSGTQVHSYDGAGNVTGIGQSRFAYDLVSRLTAAEVAAPAPTGLFFDGFETGDVSCWDPGSCVSSGQITSQAFTFDPFGNLGEIGDTLLNSWPRQSEIGDTSSVGRIEYRIPDFPVPTLADELVNAMTIDLQAAKEAAQSRIDAEARRSGIELVLLEEATIESRNGWVFFYQSRKFLETGDDGWHLAGNCPIVVNKRDGSVHMTGTAHPLEWYLHQLELGHPTE
jgi:hypothetical protein